ncbi:MAG: CoA transferase [Candidatus Hydrogenedentes bacterium]|nr:CoA transferase [Candidatus Hydrogenedentota bacterium]
MKPLEGIRAVSLAINLPGPVAAMRLRELGAEIVKIEPPSGDPLALACRAYYEHLSSGQSIVTMDLKSTADRARLNTCLAGSDLLLTAHRASALERLGLEWRVLHKQFPRLCHVALAGYPPPDDSFPGHDLMFQAASGLLDPPRMPRTPLADLGAAEEAATMAVALILVRERTGESGYAQVSIAETGKRFALPARYGLTVGGLLGGVLPSYGIYRAREGYVAFAALEAHYLERFLGAHGLQKATREEFERLFLTSTAGEWEAWARKHNVPLAAVYQFENDEG